MFDPFFFYNCSMKAPTTKPAIYHHRNMMHHNMPMVYRGSPQLFIEELVQEMKFATDVLKGRSKKYVREHMQTIERLVRDLHEMGDTLNKAITIAEMHEDLDNTKQRIESIVHQINAPTSQMNYPERFSQINTDLRALRDSVEALKSQQHGVNGKNSFKTHRKGESPALTRGSPFIFEQYTPASHLP